MSIQTLSPGELQELLSHGDVDVVDVREPDEWATGHVPGARLVPLALVHADPRGALKSDTLVFVCAKGSRSAKAAEVAAAVFGADKVVYSLNGGTEAWRGAGLPIVMPNAPASSTSTASPSKPAPALDVVVAENLKRERTTRGWSLDDLAKEAGVSRTVLGQIELGRTVPAIGVVWKLAQALGVPFSTLLASTSTKARGTTVTPRATAQKLTSADGRFTSRALFSPGDPHAAEFYELWLAPHSREDAEPHRPGTRENLIVVSGALEIKIGSEVVRVAAGDSIQFAADQPHSYINDSAEECWSYLVMNYRT
jgi:rhodanese-related sulfurtransferase/transcriptional regulator with XRE-family HTH domain